MKNEYKNLETVIKELGSSVPLLNDTEWRYSRICNTIRAVYEKQETRQDADKKGYDEGDMRLKTGSEEEEIELRRNKKSQEKIKIIDVEGN